MQAQAPCHWRTWRICWTRPARLTWRRSVESEPRVAYGHRRPRSLRSPELLPQRAASVKPAAWIKPSDQVGRLRPPRQQPPRYAINPYPRHLLFAVDDCRHAEGAGGPALKTRGPRSYGPDRRRLHTEKQVTLSTAA